MNSPLNPAPDHIQDSEIVCACVNMNYAQMNKELSAGNGENFEDFLQRTGAGQKCTACLLDLEFHYAQNPYHKTSQERNFDKIQKTTFSLKKYIFDFIDKISPLRSFPLSEWSPVLSGPGIEQWVSISNHHLLFSPEKTSLSPCAALIELRDSEGRRRYKKRHIIQPGAHLRLKISDYLEKDTSLRIGNVRIARRFLTSGLRGATRPHIEVDTYNGTCGLHLQGILGGTSNFMHLPYSPDERLFFAAINCQNRPIRMSFTYPLETEDSFKEFIVIPAFGARLHEVNLSAIKPDFKMETFGIELAAAKYPAKRRCLLIIADKNLTRFSISHP